MTTNNGYMVKAIRIYKIDKMYGGVDFLYISFNHKVVLKGCSRSCMDDCSLPYMQEYEISTKKELKERLRILEIQGFEVKNVNSMKYDELRSILDSDR